MNKFAERLKELREEKNLTQYELSKQIGISTALTHCTGGPLQLVLYFPLNENTKKCYI